MENKFSENKQKIIDIYSDKTIIDKLKSNEEFNRNFQFQIHLLLLLNPEDIQLKNIIDELKSKNILIHFFNESFSDLEIEFLLLSNYTKILRLLDNTNELTINDLINIKKDNNTLIEKRELQKKYRDCFINSKKKKWYKKIQSKAIVASMFLAFITKIRDKKFKLLLNDTIDNLNNDYNLNIDKELPDKEFLKVFYEYVINSSVKKSLIIVLSILVASFIIVLTTILVLT